MPTTFGFKEQKKKIMIICQGEGKGHITQAIAFFEAAKDCDVRVYITKNDSIPKYADKLNYKTFDSLTFKFNKDGSVNNTLTFFNNICNISKIVKSAIYLRKEYNDFLPDMVVNFYEILGGLIFNNSICIAHQYKFLHPDYKFPKNKPVSNLLLKAFTRLTCLRANSVYALSWYRMFDHSKIKVIPPILRKEIYIPSRYPVDRNEVVAYVKGDFANAVIKWGFEQHYDKKIIIYSNEHKYSGSEIRNVYFKPISDDFTDRIKNCSNYISNAGFESIAEALLWKKDVFVHPIKGQYEQVCNANDLKSNNLGNSGYDYPIYDIEFTNQEDVSDWIRQGEFICTSIINEVTIYSLTRNAN